MTVDVPTQLRELAEVGSLSFQRSADSPVRTEFPKLAARLLATEHLKRDDRFPALRLNVNSEIVADVLINQSNHPLAARFLRD